MLSEASLRPKLQIAGIEQTTGADPNHRADTCFFFTLAERVGLSCGLAGSPWSSVGLANYTVNEEMEQRKGQDYKAVNQKNLRFSHCFTAIGIIRDN